MVVCWGGMVNRIKMGRGSYLVSCFFCLSDRVKKGPKNFRDEHSSSRKGRNNSKKSAYKGK